MILTEQALLDLLEEQHIDYTVRKHEPIYTVAEGEALGLPNARTPPKAFF